MKKFRSYRGGRRGRRGSYRKSKRGGYKLRSYKNSRGGIRL